MKASNAEDDILQRADELMDKICALPDSSDKYERGVKALLTANIILLITLIWKSFDLPDGLTLSAKVSVFFFAIGAVFAVLRYILDYFSDGLENKPLMDEASNFFIENKQLLKEQRADVYEMWAIQAAMFRGVRLLSAKYYGTDSPSVTLIQLVYIVLEYASLAISGASFIIGIFFLVIVALFS